VIKNNRRLHLKTSSTSALSIQNLTKHFGAKKAVENLSLTVPTGVFYGLVGPNGAGKTTALSMVAGLLRPTSGQTFITGYDVWKKSDYDKAMSAVGIIMDGLSFPERLTASELFEYTGMLRGLSAKDVQKRSKDLLEILELDKARSTLIVDFSTGMRKKAALAVAMMHAPKILVLDEPFEAIDPVSTTAIEALLKQYVAAGGTVVLSSHVMAFVERLCDYVAVIAKGTLLAEGTVKEVADGKSLQDRFVSLVGAPPQQKQLEWLA
jgi:ABC-2 type transport system ATP-binding protein